MIKKEKQPVDVTEQPIVFMACISFSCFLLLLLNSVLLRTIIFISLLFVYL